MNGKIVNHKRILKQKYFYLPLFAFVFAFFNLSPGLLASDHGDEEEQPLFAQLTDLYTFVQEENLVIALCSNPKINETNGINKTFPDNVFYTIRIDHDSQVHFGDCCDKDRFGGTVKKPEWIKEDIIFTITFKDGKPTVKLDGEGLPGIVPPISEKYCVPTSEEDIQVCADLRDDPFIRNPRKGENVAAIVLEFPLWLVTKNQVPLLIWATSHTNENLEMQSDLEEAGVALAGRALRSMFEEELNTLHPSKHVSKVGVKVPDVMICNTSTFNPDYGPGQLNFPNCRGLTDDVVQYLVCEEFISPLGSFNRISECSTVRKNDKDFLPHFPYLAEPHEPPKTNVD